MPIRFRCSQCGALLGIARRKSGSTVKCPSCKKPLVVPEPEPAGVRQDQQTLSGEQEAVAAPPLRDLPPAKPVGIPLFERDDFEELLNPEPMYRSSGEKSRRNRGREMPPPLPGENPFELPVPEDIPTLQPVRPPGLYISPNRATWLSVAAVVALAIVFTAGLLVGRFLKP